MALTRLPGEINRIYNNLEGLSNIQFPLPLMQSKTLANIKAIHDSFVNCLQLYLLYSSHRYQINEVVGEAFQVAKNTL